MSTPRRHPCNKSALKVFWLAIVLSFSLAQNIYAENLPDIGDTAGRILTPEDERRIGEQFFRQLQQNATIIEDAEINQYIQSLGLSLVSNSDDPFQAYRFFMVDNNTVNAFAAPGGYIGIHSGLMFATRNEGELASVFAHEIAHITQRHIARAIEAQSKAAPLNTAALLAAILLGAAGNGQAASAAVATSVAGSAQRSINFTRANEKEADRTGITILARSGINPSAMPDFFGRLEQVSRVNQSALPEFLRTHPITRSRIADSRARADQYEDAGRKDSEYFQLIKARLRVLLAEDKQAAVKQFESEVEKEDANLASRYGLALAYSENGQYQKARELLKKLLQQSPDDKHFTNALARVEMNEGNDTLAVKLLSENFELNPHNHAVTLNYAEALLLTNEPVKTQRLLQEHIRRGNTQSATTYKLLAEALGKTNSTIEAHESLAEYHYLSGDRNEAINQLEIAIKRAKNKDSLAIQRIEARLEQLRPEKDKKS